jgi:hypothetical protein
LFIVSTFFCESECLADGVRHGYTSNGLYAMREIEWQ